MGVVSEKKFPPLSDAYQNLWRFVMLPSIVRGKNRIPTVVKWASHFRNKVFFRLKSYVGHGLPSVTRHEKLLKNMFLSIWPQFLFIIQIVCVNMYIDYLTYWKQFFNKPVRNLVKEKQPHIFSVHILNIKLRRNSHTLFLYTF